VVAAGHVKGSCKHQEALAPTAQNTAHAAPQLQHPGGFQGPFAAGGWHRTEVSLSNSSAAGKCQEQRVLGPGQPLQLHAPATQSAAQPWYAACPGERRPAAERSAASLTIPHRQRRRRTGNTQDGSALHHAPAADAMPYKSRCLGRAGKAGPGRTDLPSAASTQAEGPAAPSATRGLQHASRAGERLSRFTLPGQSLTLPAAGGFGSLTPLPAVTLPPSRALSGGTNPWPGCTPNWAGLPHPVLQTKHTLRQAPASVF